MDYQRAVKILVACCALVLGAAAGCSARSAVSASPTPAALLATLGPDELHTQGAHAIETIWAKQTANAPSPTAPPPPTSTTIPPSWCPLQPPSAAKPQGKTRTTYVVQGDAWVVDEGRQPLQLTQTGDVAAAYISTDGKVITLTRKSGDYASEVWAVKPDGTNLRRLLSASDMARLGQVDDITQLGRGESPQIVAYLPLLTRIPGRHIIAINVVPYFSGPEAAPGSANDLWLLNIDTGAVRKILAHFQGGNPLPSPDGSLIAVEGVKKLNLVQLDNLKVTTDILPAYVVIGASSYDIFPQLVWAADSRSMQVATVSGGNPFLDAGTTTHVWSVPVDGSAPREEGVFDAFYPVFRMSPDGRYAIYWRDPRRDNSREFFIASIDGAEKRRFMEGGIWLQIGDWTADSRHFFFGKDYGDDWGGQLIGDICGGFRPATPEEYAAFRWSHVHGGTTAPPDVTWDSYSVGVIDDN